MLRKSLEKKIEDAAKNLDKLICEWYSIHNPESKERYWSGTGRNYNDSDPTIRIIVSEKGNDEIFTSIVDEVPREW